MVRPGIEKQSVRTTTQKQPRSHSPDAAGRTPDLRSSSENRIPGPAFQEIAELAYTYWEARKGNSGSPEDDWFHAERELTLRVNGDLGPKRGLCRGRSASEPREQ